MSSKIRIKNFGPIKEGVENNGWIEIKKVTAFIGNQGSGKSTVAKLISTFTWLEKVLTRGDYKIEHYSRRNGFVKKLLPYHRLENYIIKDQEGNIVTEIQYEGCSYNISFKKGELKVVHKGRVDYSLPQIMYVPAERNFIAYVKKPNELKLSSDSLKEFLSEFNDAKENIKGTLDLPINQVNLDYDKLNDVLNVKG